MSTTDIVQIVTAKLKSDRYKFEEPEIELAVQEIEQCVKNYCNIAIIPTALNFTISNMTIDLLLYQSERNKTSEELKSDDLVDGVASISIGDTSIKEGTDNSSIRSTVLKGHALNLDSIVMNYRQQLNQFRVIY